MNKIIVTIILLLSISSIAMANQEKLVVYTYDSFASEWGPGPSVEKSFEKLCKCDLEFIGMDSSIGILGRLKLEGKKRFSGKQSAIVYLERASQNLK